MSKCLVLVIYLCMYFCIISNVCIQKTLKYAEVGFYTKVSTIFWKRTIVFAKCLKAHKLVCLILLLFKQ